MVHEGWSFADLMAMSVSDFAFWFKEQEAYARRQAEEARG